MELAAIPALIIFFIFIIVIACIVRAAKNQSARQSARAAAIAEETSPELENGSTEASAPVREEIGRISETVNDSFQIEENENQLCDLPPAYEDLFIKN